MLCLCPLCLESAPCHQFCAHCSAQLLTQGHHCQLCFEVIPTPLTCCAHCLKSPLPWERLSAVNAFREPWASLIKQLKYRRQLSLVYPMAELLARQIRKEVRQQPAWQLVAMPMHSQRLKERGFNQAALLAQALADKLRLPYVQPLYRKTNTTALEQLTRAQRQQTVANAFACKPIRGHWILVDDVLTTGASMLAAGRTMRAAGAQRLWIATLAKTPD